MGWNKLKLLLLAGLLFANIVLAIFLVSLRNESQYIDENSYLSATKLLEEYGIHVAENAVDRKIIDVPIFIGATDVSLYEEIAGFMSGSTVERIFTTPDGIIVSLTNGSRAAFFDGFGVRYTTQDYANVFESSREYSNVSGVQMRSAEKTLKSYFQTFKVLRNEQSQIADITFRCTSVKQDKSNGILYCDVQQYVNNTPIANFSVTAAIDNDTVVAFQGYWCFSDVQSAIHAQMMDQVNILYNIRNKISQLEADVQPIIIENLSIGYSVYFHSSDDRFYLIPVWTVTLSDGRIFTFNATDGA